MRGTPAPVTAPFPVGDVIGRGRDGRLDPPVTQPGTMRPGRVGRICQYRIRPPAGLAIVMASSTIGNPEPSLARGVVESKHATVPRYGAKGILDPLPHP